MGGGILGDESFFGGDEMYSLRCWTVALDLGTSLLSA